MKRTIATELAALDEKIETFRREMETRRAVLESLAGTIAELPPPLISNESARAFFDQPGAWLTWSAPFYGENFTGADILRGLEAAGFTPMPATLCKWDDYRPHTEPGRLDDIPEKKGRYTLTDATPIAPLWIEVNGHTGPEARAYYRAGDRVYKVSVPVPAGIACVTARRIEVRGDWYYDRGSARLHFPQAWHAIGPDNGDRVAGIAAQSRAWRDTEQGISGSIYFEPYTEQDAFPLTPAALLALLITKAVARA